LDHGVEADLAASTSVSTLRVLALADLSVKL